MVLTVAKAINIEITLDTLLDFICTELNNCFKHIPSQVLDLAVILCVMQILDGSLTAMGISIFGTEAEGNPILRNLMEQIGYANTLIIAKSLAVLVIAYLASIAHIVSWVKYAFISSIIFYLTMAILPWAAILSRHLA